MPSPPLVPDAPPIDAAHLKRMTLGDVGVEREALAMFASQVGRLMETPAAPGAATLALAHTLKGSARAIGAFAVADAAEALESAGEPGERASAMAALEQALAEARAAIAVMLRGS